MPDQPKRRSLDSWLAVVIAVGTLWLLTKTIDRPVITWDEGFSIRREERMREWFRLLVSPPQSETRGRLFSESVIERFWQFAREEPDGHPPFYAVIGNIGWLLCNSWLPIIEAHRFGPIVLFSFTLGVMYRFVARRFGRLAAMTAVGSWLLMPRVFAHAHLASYDMPLACLWILTVVAFWKAREGWQFSFSRGLIWSLVFAVVLALAAATKFTGWLIPIPLLGWSIAAGLRTLRRDGVPSLRKLNRPAACLSILVALVPLELHLMRGVARTEASLDQRPGENSQFRAKRAADAFRATRTTGLFNLALFAPAAIWLVTYGSLARKRSIQTNAISPIAETWAAASLVPALTVALVPNWWHDPLRGVAIFLWSNLTRQKTTWIPTQFFDTLYEFSLPWYNTLAWVALTVPPLTLLLLLIGAAVTLLGRVRIEDREASSEPRHSSVSGDPQSSILNPQSLSWLLILNAATLLIIRALPGAPGHDAERQLLGSFPFLACLAGLGAEWLRVQLGRRVTATAANWLVRGLVGLSLVWAAADIWHYRAAPLSYYTELVGGLNGATRRGLEPTYYWDSLDHDVLDWLAQNTSSGEKVLFCNYAEDSFHYLEQSGKLRVNIWPHAPGVWRWYVLQNRPGLFAETPWNRILAREGAAAYTCELDGVPLIWIFPFEEYEKAIRATQSR